MSIPTDITRLQNAKAAIKTAIEGKGVTVPDATLLDGMASLIESIVVGGGGSATSITGTITLNGSWSKVNLLTYEELTNVFGETLPTLFVAIYRTSAESSHTIGCLWVSNQKNAIYLYRSAGTSGSTQAAALSESLPTITKTEGLIIPRHNSYYFKSGEYYYSVSRYDG